MKSREPVPYVEESVEPITDAEVATEDIRGMEEAEEVGEVRKWEEGRGRGRVRSKEVGRGRGKKSSSLDS